MSGGFFRGTTADQDTRFSNKQAKLMKSQKFAPELENLIDMTKVKMDVMRPWIAHRVTELLGFEDEVLINFIYGLLEEKVVNGKKIQITLTGFMEKNTGKFMKELWTHLLSAQKNASGVPQEFLDAKAEEAMKKKVETDRIASEIQRKKEKEGQELEQERLKKMGGVDGVSRAKNAASEPSTRHETKDSRGDEKDLMERNGSRGRSSGRRRSRSTSVSPQPRRRSVSSGKVHRSPSRRSVTPQQSLSPPRRESSQFRRRSVSRSRLRSPSPITHMKKSPMQRRSRSPMRHRSRSPVRRRSRSPMRRRSRTPVRRRSRSPMRRRSRSPMKRRSRSPIRRRSRSPVRRVSRSPIRRRSRSPIRRRSRPPVRPRSRSPGYRFVSRSPLRRRSRSPLQRRSRSPTRPMTPSPEQRGSQSPSRGSSLSPGPGRSPSPVRRQLSSPVRPPVRGRSPPPPIRRYRRAPSTPRRRSPSPLRRRASNGGRQGSPSPRRRSLSPQERTSLSPIHRAPRRRSPLRSPRDNLRTIKKYSPVRRATLREKTEHTVESGKGPGSSERRPVSERSPQRDIRDRNDLRKKAPVLSPSAFKSPSYAESPAAARSTVVDRRSSSPESPAEQMRDAAILVDSASLTMRKDKPIRESVPSSVKHEEVNFAREEDKKPKSSAKIKMHSVVADERTNSVENTRYKKEPSPERLADHRSGEVRIRTDYAELKKKDQKPMSENNAGRVPYDAKGHDGLNDLENVSKLPRKIGGNGRSGSVDSGSEESDDQRVEVKGKRKHKRSRKKDVTSDDDDSYDSHVEERKEAKRRQKEEKKLKKEERRRRRAERRRRKDDRHSKKQKGNSGGNISPPSDFENNHDGSASEGDRVARKKSRVMDREEEIPEQKRLEIELREKALESLRAKKGVGH